MVKNPFVPVAPKVDKNFYKPENQSMGILEDFDNKKNINTSSIVIGSTSYKVLAGGTSLGSHNIRIGINSTPRIVFEYKTTPTSVYFEVDNNGTYWRVFRPNFELFKLDQDGNAILSGEMSASSVRGTFISSGDNAGITTVLTVGNFSDITVEDGLIVGYTPV